MAEGKKNKKSRARGTTVMVIEPDILARVVIAEYLRECGYKVVEGAIAEDVFALLRAKFRVEIFLIEVRLPGAVDGFELARQLRIEAPEAEVILTSSIKLSADKAAGLCDDGPLERPFHPQEVVRRIQRLRQSRSATGLGSL